MSGRLFFALDIPEHIQTILCKAIGFPSGMKGARWVKKENYHLTLLFLGEQDRGAIQKWTAMVREWAGNVSPFNIVFKGWGCFPNPAKARVLFIGVENGARETLELARHLQAIVQLPGVPSGFKPHLTVARFREPTRVAFPGEIPPVELPVREITLFSSTLTAKGPIYTVEDKFWFSGIVTGE